ncbi:MAG: PVC-type heme-binding CxxCH protein [Gemmataceae bacterium]
MKRWFASSALLLFLSVCPSAAADKPLPLQEAPKRMTLPEGFKATLFAGEPDVVQPIAFTFDDRGRLWVVECTSYPQWTDKKEGKDRVLIFEDKDGDGHFDTCNVFWNKGANLTGIELGFGGVWLCSTPNLIFIPIKEGTDEPAGPPQVILDGWDLKAQHNVFNSLTWGPDGWLYGCNGILSNARVGAPGTLDAKRVRMNCGVWRYHPTKKMFEAVAHGTTNPWGLDFDDYGRMFITNCVIKHLFHVIPGAHFQRMYGQDLNPNCYALMESCADHIHWAGGDWTTSRGGKGEHSDKGGGHAHSGAMVYLGDNWPAEYRNNVFMCNIHGNRINRDVIEEQGSGVVARHGKDFLFANDEWFRGIALQYGPDGGVFVTDWCDTGECHNYVEVDRSNGRIYKVTHGQTKPFRDNPALLPDADLVKLQRHKNDWMVRHARRLLQERAHWGKLDKETPASLKAILKEEKDVTRRLRALWALFAIGALDDAQIVKLLGDSQENLRVWAVQLAVDDRNPSEAVVGQLLKLAGDKSSLPVRLSLASALQRLPLEQGWRIAEVLLKNSDDAKDVNLPLMLWYGVEPLVATNSEKGMSLLAHAEIPLIRQYIARRLASQPATSGDALPGVNPLIELAGRIRRNEVQRDILAGILEALKGRRDVPIAKGWAQAYPILEGSQSEEVRDLALTLAVLFDDERALQTLRKTIQSKDEPSARREKALQTLIFKQKPDLLPLLKELLGDKDLRASAIRGLAAFTDDKIPSLLLHHYSSFTPSEKADVIQTLASRPAYALALLDAIEKGRIPRTDVSAFAARQMVELKNKQVSERVAKVWGTVRSSSQDKVAQMAKYKAMLTPDYLRPADVSNGRVVFSKTCASCHRLFDEGARIGPELTGSQRANLDYFLENVLDPSAVVAKEYQMSLVELNSGRVITGIIKDENEQSITVQTEKEAIVVPKKEIESRTQSPVSMMPEGLLDKLTKEEVRDLVSYLASPTQALLPKAEKTK